MIISLDWIYLDVTKFFKHSFVYTSEMIAVTYNLYFLVNPNEFSDINIFECFFFKILKAYITVV